MGSSHRMVFFCLFQENIPSSAGKICWKLDGSSGVGTSDVCRYDAVSAGSVSFEGLPAHFVCLYGSGMPDGLPPSDFLEAVPERAGCLWTISDGNCRNCGWLRGFVYPVIGNYQYGAGIVFYGVHLHDGISPLQKDERELLQGKGSVKGGKTGLLDREKSVL